MAILHISILTVFPELYETFLQTSLIARAQQEQRVSFELVRFSHMTAPGERIDVPICGPGAGMLLKPEVITKALDYVTTKHGQGYRIFFSPQGKVLNQHLLRTLTTQFFDKAAREDGPLPKAVTSHLILVCPRYEGVDERVIETYADAVLSIGDYVLMGGDIPAQVFIEGLLRLFPGVVGSLESVLHESFNGPFLDYPTYGQPILWRNKKVPDIILSGNHAAIDTWRTQKAAEKTITQRFDWFSSSPTTKKERELATQSIPPHYVALMHTDVLLKGNHQGETSITSLDIHDIARSSATYGIKSYFLVTPLEDQRLILEKFLSFWHSEEGRQYNQSRFDAVKQVKHAPNLSAVIDAIERQEGIKPVVIATSAKQHIHTNIIDYKSQGTVWRHKRPVLFIFGTGQGLTESRVKESDYLLLPVGGVPEYKHLSVRSAVAIVLDRWLGLNPILYPPVDKS